MINASLPRIYLATSNPGKIRDFKAAAANLRVNVQALPGIESLAQPVEDGPTFEANACIKAEYYSRKVAGEIVAADDSGLVVEALNGAPGVYSARYAAVVDAGPGSHARSHANSNDEENNRALIRQLGQLPSSNRSGKFVCVIAVARDGKTLQAFYGEVSGQLLAAPRGTFGFGYDPLFYFPALDKTFAELTPEEKAKYSHRGQAFRKLLEWAHQVTGSSDHRVIEQTNHH